MNKTVFFFIFIPFFLISCNPGSPKSDIKKILYINSYHEGYGSSDDVMRGITETLAEEQYDLEIFFMDTKRHASEDSIRQKVEQVLKLVDLFDPELIIASDDNAVKYVIAGHFKNAEIPVVFCGVNWSAAQYGLPVSNITGMLEVLPLRDLLGQMKEQFPEYENLVVLSEYSNSEINNKQLLDTLFSNLGFGVEYHLVKTFDQWKTAFSDAQLGKKIVYTPTNGAISGWNEDEAVQHVKQMIKNPVVTCDDFMMKYCVYGLTKVAREQGEWAAKTAMDILGGKKPADIPVTKNIQTKAWVNKPLADAIGFEVPEKNVEIIRK